MIVTAWCCTVFWRCSMLRQCLAAFVSSLRQLALQQQKQTTAKHANAHRHKLLLSTLHPMPATSTAYDLVGQARLNFIIGKATQEGLTSSCGRLLHSCGRLPVSALCSSISMRSWLSRAKEAGSRPPSTAAAGTHACESSIQQRLGNGRRSTIRQCNVPLAGACSCFTHNGSIFIWEHS